MTEWHDIMNIAQERHLDMGNDVRVYLGTAIKKSKYSREQICERMSLLTGKTITKAQLDSWTAESKRQHNFPTAYLPAFVIASGNSELLEFVCKEAGGVFMKPQKMRKELSDIERKIETLEIRRKEILENLLDTEMNSKGKT